MSDDPNIDDVLNGINDRLFQILERISQIEAKLEKITEWKDKMVNADKPIRCAECFRIHNLGSNPSWFAGLRCMKCSSTWCNAHREKNITVVFRCHSGGSMSLPTTGMCKLCTTGQCAICGNVTRDTNIFGCQDNKCYIECCSRECALIHKCSDIL